MDKQKELLKKAGIKVEIVSFETKDVKGVEAIANKLGVEPGQVVKTLILKGKSGKFYMCLAGGNSKIEYKVLKVIFNEEDMGMASPAEIKEQTGFDVGAIASFGLKNELKTIISKELFNYDKIYVGTGVFGNDFVMSADDLMKIAKAEIFELSAKSGTTALDVKCNEMNTKFKMDQSNFISISQAMDKGSGEVSIRGWVYRIRMSNKFCFIVMRDSSDIIQCVVKDDNKEMFDAASKLTMESSVMLSGIIKKDERAPTGYEIEVKELETVQVSEPFPITKDFSPEYLLDNRHVWIRSRKMVAMLKIRHTIVGAIHEFFRSRGYFEFDAPIFQPNACEGGSTLFEVKFFGDKVYLSQSWQLYAEAGIFALEKIYNMSPTFRSEKSKTSRHLAEFWMAEMEAAWMDLNGCAQVAKDEIKFIVKKVLENNEKELKILERDISKLKPTLEKEIPTISYTEVLRLLKEKKGMDVEWGKDLRTIEEEKVMELFDTPVVVTDYPKEIMAFYKKRRLPKPKEAKEDVALCFDMLAPEAYGEIIGGSQRDTDIKELQKYLKLQGEKPEHYEWYLDLRKYGSVPHSGYGLGVERVVRWICGIENIKDAIPFPRTMLRKAP